MKKIKISLFAIIVIVMGVAGSAFNSFPENMPPATHVFEFDGSQGYSSTNVSDVRLWNYVGESSNQPMCSGNTKACRIAVSDEYLDSENPELLSDELIISVSGTIVAKVAGVSDPQGIFSNQP